MSKIKVMNTEISVQKVNGEDYISLTDMVGCKKISIQSRRYHKKLD